MSWLKFVPTNDPLRDRQQDEPVCRCPVCDGEIYAGDIGWDVDGDLLCSEDCAKDHALNLMGYRRRGYDE